MAEKDQGGNVSREYQTAIHEAAHAVVGLHNRMTIRGVTIVPDDERLGYCKHDNMFYEVPLDVLPHDDPDFPEHFYNAIRDAMMSFAGPFAEEEYLDNKSVEGYEDDYDEGVDILSTFVGTNEQCQALVDYVEVCTRDLLRSPSIRKQIYALADALVKHRQLTGDEAKEVLYHALSR